MAFCQNIKVSKAITAAFNACAESYYESLTPAEREGLVRVEARHVDGSMGAARREEHLGWLKRIRTDGLDCHLLSNVRCLSEGVDVPSLDAVVFLAAKNSQVDVVQSVGRVMRRAEGKKYGYIIIPIVVPSDVDPEKALDVSIERRLEAMRQFYEAGIDTTCFISPIFPGITDVEAIIDRAKGQCNLVWLENLNLRGDYKGRILQWVHEHHPRLDTLYRDIYTRKDRTYWHELNADLSHFCADRGLRYVRNDDTTHARHGEPPVVVNYFYHEEIIPSACKEQLRQTRICC